MQRRILLTAILSTSLVAAGACEHHAYGQPKGSESIDVAAKLTITRDSAGIYDFKYDAPFADADGNFDFSKGEAYGKVVKLSFAIADDAGLGLTFKKDPRDAMWIVDKKNVGADGSPQGPFRGKQWFDFRVSDDGRTLFVTDQNDDGVLYRYGLRFDLGGQTVVDDPDANNGSGGHGGNN
jgi:hypothetical protein